MFDKKEYMKQYRIINREKLLRQMRENRKKYYLKNKEKELVYNKNWKENNPGYNKKYYQENREHYLELNKKYYHNNREYILKLMKKWRVDNKDYCKEYSKKYYKTEAGKANKQRTKSKRRARMKNIINTLTTKDWLDLLKKYKYKCAYCDKEFNLFDRPERDHIIPISKGGHNTKKNVVPACRKCNGKKSNKILKEDKQKRK